MFRMDTDFLKNKQDSPPERLVKEKHTANDNKGAVAKSFCYCLSLLSLKYILLTLGINVQITS